MDAQVPASEPQAAAPVETKFPALVWRTRRTTYLIVFVVCYMFISLFIYAAFKEKDLGFLLPFFGPMFAAPAWNCLWLFMSGSSFRLVDDRLDILAGDNTRSIFLKDIVTVQSSLSKESKDEATIIIATRDKRIVIPRYITLRSDKVYREICDRIEYFQTALHRSDATPDEEELDGPPPPGPWSRYPDLPRELHELLAEQRGRGQEMGVLVFGGPANKRARNGVSVVRQLAIWMAVLGLIIAALMAANKNVSQAGVGIGFAVFGSVIAALTFIHRSYKRKTEWFVVHPDGIAMMGAHLTGELAWKDVRTVHSTAPKTFISEGAPPSPTEERFAIESRDDAKIIVPDVYDAPVFLIARCVRSFWGEYKRAELNRTMANTETP